MAGICAACSILRAFFLAEGFVFQKGGQFALVDGDGFGKTGFAGRRICPLSITAGCGGAGRWCS